MAVGRDISVEIVDVKEEEGLYRVRIRIVRDGKTREIDIPRMVKKPSLVRHEVSDDHLIIKFIDDSGEGICSCCILLSEV